eukprot:Nitzschia sp. Nitz4//scaffold376_size14603//6340//7017//NITZ4_008920-RA/size14603-processed-gene-0.8-mRNA-1//1//CDS//3329549658//1928//frame0
MKTALICVCLLQLFVNCEAFLPAPFWPHVSNTDTTTCLYEGMTKKERHEEIAAVEADTYGRSPVATVPNGPPEQDELADFIRFIAKTADDKKGNNIVALRVSAINTAMSFLVLVSGNSVPQNQAIADAVMDGVREKYKLRPVGSGGAEGKARSGWVLLDYGNVMVHVMDRKSRNYYSIEEYWSGKGAEYLDLSDVVISHSDGSSAPSSSDPTEPSLEPEQDPFWS